jgi:hypothetical protein
MIESTHTKYAPAERASWEQLYAQIIALKGNVFLQEKLHEVADRTLLINAHRQVVYANAAMLEYLGQRDPAELMGCRPGEVFGCLNADKGAGGCGTSESCHLCGALNAVLRSLAGYAEVQRCSITLKENGAQLELTVHSIPVRIAGYCMCLLVLTPDDHGNSKQLAEVTFRVQRYAANIEDA